MTLRELLRAAAAVLVGAAAIVAAGWVPGNAHALALAGAACWLVAQV